MTKNATDLITLQLVFRTDQFRLNLLQIRSDPKFIKSDSIRSETEPDLINSDPNLVRICLDLIQSDLNSIQIETDLEPI